MTFKVIHRLHSFVPNFVSFVVSIGKLVHGEKSPTHSLTHPAYFMSREPKLVLRKMSNIWPEGSQFVAGRQRGPKHTYNQTNE